jgi:hypothetical protein
MASPVAGQGRRSRGLQVTRHAARAPFPGKYEQFWADGSYHCICCGNKLFDSPTKFDAGCGWPSFDQAVPGAITNIVDRSHGMVRTETVQQLRRPSGPCLSRPHRYRPALLHELGLAGFPERAQK